jgi:hypothetical protein
VTGSLAASTPGRATGRREMESNRCLKKLAEIISISWNE